MRWRRRLVAPGRACPFSALATKRYHSIASGFLDLKLDSFESTRRWVWRNVPLLTAAISKTCWPMSTSIVCHKSSGGATRGQVARHEMAAKTCLKGQRGTGRAARWSAARTIPDGTCPKRFDHRQVGLKRLGDRHEEVRCHGPVQWSGRPGWRRQLGGLPPLYELRLAFGCWTGAGASAAEVDPLRASEKFDRAYGRRGPISGP